MGREAEADRRAAVLVVEDVAPVRMLVARQLAGFGLGVDTAENGQVALERLSVKRYDLAIVDLMMPILDGFEVARRRRAAEAADPALGRLPMVALTARLDEHEAVRCREVGFDGCLAKPLQIEEAARLVERLVGRLPETAKSQAGAPQEKDAAIDFARFRSNLGDADEDLVFTLLDRFRQSLAQLVAAIEAAATARQAAALERAAHAAHGGARNACAAELAARCARLERAADAADWPAIEAALPPVRESAAAVERAIARLAGSRRS